jgi:hypothetical protein
MAQPNDARRPKGYRGLDHETIGTDILAVLRVLTLPQQLLGEALTRRCQQVQPDGWYPIGLLLELTETLALKVGPTVLVQMGRRLFELSHAERFKRTARSAADLVYGIDGLYRAANRGDDIGGWKVRSFGPGKATLEKSTPHHCALEEGIVHEALRSVGVPATVRQSSCFRQGAQTCVFELGSVLSDVRWHGGRPFTPE